MPDVPDEAVDIDMERRRFILDVHGKLATLTHYEVLGIDVGADKKTVKRAYFELVRTMHPDRYFGKNLGTYRPKMEAIFHRMTEAYEALTSPATRAAYDAARGSAPPASGRPARVVDPAVAAQRQAAMDALKERFVQAKAKAREHANAAARARAFGDLVTAAEEYKRALQLTPADAQLEAAYREVEREVAARLVEGHRRKAELEERWGRWASAVESWRRIVEARPDDVEARTRLAAALSRAGEAG